LVLWCAGSFELCAVSSLRALEAVASCVERSHLVTLGGVELASVRLGHCTWALVTLEEVRRSVVVTKSFTSLKGGLGPREVLSMSCRTQEESLSATDMSMVASHVRTFSLADTANELACNTNLAISRWCEMRLVHQV
jgi:hypothetical protein